MSDTPITDAFRRMFAEKDAELATLRAKLEETERECERLHKPIVCSVCAGTGKPLSGLPCICRGTGTQDGELQGFRDAHYDLSSHLAALQEQHRQQSEELARANGLLAKLVHAATKFTVGCNCQPASADDALSSVLDEVRTHLAANKETT